MGTKSSSVEIGAIHQTLTSALRALRARHRQPIRREGSVFVTTASRIQPLARHGLQRPQQQWDVNRRLCGWSRRIRKTLVLETKLSLLLLELLSWLPFSTYRFSGYGSPVSSYIQWRPLNTAADLILSSRWSDYTLWPALQSLLLHIPAKGPHKPRKNYFFFSLRQHWSLSINLSWETKINPVCVISSAVSQLTFILWLFISKS